MKLDDLLSTKSTLTPAENNRHRPQEHAESNLFRTLPQTLADSETRASTGFPQRPQLPQAFNGKCSKKLRGKLASKGMIVRDILVAGCLVTVIDSERKPLSEFEASMRARFGARYEGII